MKNFFLCFKDCSSKERKGGGSGKWGGEKKKRNFLNFWVSLKKRNRIAK
jgi:hypothetical protein